MNPKAVQRKLAAILSADVVGYSRLMAEDEAETVKTLNAHKDLMGGLIRQHAGRVVDAVGDNLLAEFASVVDAVACAAAIQHELAVRNQELPPHRRMLFRVGVNLGDVIVEEDRIYGDGVNIAARIQTLADEGGVSISGTAFDHVEGKLRLEFEDLGQHSVRNIPRPVRVYRVKVAKDSDSALPSLSVPGFSGRPAIAVLPFDNLSGDPEQEYFADGIAEDLITRLSAWRGFPVIARNSSFLYKGKAVDVKQVSRELGVRYVVEGSVRKAGDLVRIGAQLIDATTGHHVWAKTYDRELRDVFALQDEITQAIVASMHPELMQFESERAVRQQPERLDAWEFAHRAWWHYNQYTRDDSAKARLLYEKALELEPSFAWAFAGLALTHFHEIFYQWTDSPARSIDELVRAAERSVSLDARDPFGQLALGQAYSLRGHRDKEHAAYKLALQLNPSLALGYYLLGVNLAATGHPAEAIANLDRAMRLSPRDPWMMAFLTGMAAAQFAAGRYEEVVGSAQQSLQWRPDWPPAYGFLAASYAHLGRHEQARAALEERLRLQPGYSLAHVKLLVSSMDPDFAERFIDGLRKAGLKE